MAVLFMFLFSFESLAHLPVWLIERRGGGSQRGGRAGRASRGKAPAPGYSLELQPLAVRTVSWRFAAFLRCSNCSEKLEPNYLLGKKAFANYPSLKNVG